MIGLGASARWETFDCALLDETLDDCLISSGAVATLQKTGLKQKIIPVKHYRLRDGSSHECSAEIDARWAYAGTAFSRSQVFRIAPRLNCDVLFGKAYAEERRSSEEDDRRTMAPFHLQRGENGM